MDYKKGQKVVICKDTIGGSNFNATIGTILWIVGKYNSCGKKGYNVSFDERLQHSGYVLDNEIRPYELNRELLSKLITDCEKTLIETQKEIEGYKNKVKFLNEHNLETFDEEDYKAYEVLKVMGMDDIEKAKTIMKILKS